MPEELSLHLPECLRGVSARSSVTHYREDTDWPRPSILREGSVRKRAERKINFVLQSTLRGANMRRER